MNDSASTPNPAPVRGACPGVAAPMATGDGLLLRIRHPIGGLDADQTRAIAEVARRHGSGALELTSRGNLQIRGVTPDRLAAARAALETLGLVDADPEREAIRNVLVAPLCDIDPAAVDVGPTARALSKAMLEHPTLRALPPKVGVLVDGGGAAPLEDTAADLRLEAVHDGSRVVYRLAVGATAREATLLRRVPEETAVAAAIEVLERFVALREHHDPAPRRLAEAVSRAGASALSPRAATPDVRTPDPVTAGAADRPPEPGDHGRWLGVAFPFGALTATQLEALAAEVTETAGRVRLTPWRMLLLTGFDPTAAERLTAAGAILDGDDPRRRLSACIGRPGCQWASTTTRDDALGLATAIAALPGSGTVLDVDGCAKACSRSRSAPLLLVAEEGRYHVQVRENGELRTLATGHPPRAARDLVTTLARRILASKREEENVQETIDRIGADALATRPEEGCR